MHHSDYKGAKDYTREEPISLLNFHWSKSQNLGIIKHSLCTTNYFSDTKISATPTSSAVWRGALVTRRYCGRAGGTCRSCGINRRCRRGTTRSKPRKAPSVAELVGILKLGYFWIVVQLIRRPTRRRERHNKQFKT